MARSHRMGLTRVVVRGVVTVARTVTNRAAIKAQRDHNHPPTTTTTVHRRSREMRRPVRALRRRRRTVPFGPPARHRPGRTPRVPRTEIGSPATRLRTPTTGSIRPGRKIQPTTPDSRVRGKLSLPRATMARHQHRRRRRRPPPAKPPPLPTRTHPLAAHNLVSGIQLGRRRRRRQLGRRRRRRQVVRPTVMPLRARLPRARPRAQPARPRPRRDSPTSLRRALPPVRARRCRDRRPVKTVQPRRQIVSRRPPPRHRRPRGRRWAVRAEMHSPATSMGRRAAGRNRAYRGMAAALPHSRVRSGLGWDRAVLARRRHHRRRRRPGPVRPR